MTIIPPSVTDGEARQWCGDAIGPAPIDHRILRRRCALLATGALVYRYVGTTPARTPWKPGWDHPRLLWECDHELGRRACGWLGKPAPDEPTRRQRAERSPIDVELDELAAAITTTTISTDGTGSAWRSTSPQAAVKPGLSRSTIFRPRAQNTTRARPWRGGGITDARFRADWAKER